MSILLLPVVKTSVPFKVASLQPSNKSANTGDETIRSSYPRGVKILAHVGDWYNTSRGELALKISFLLEHVNKPLPIDD